MRYRFPGAVINTQPVNCHTMSDDSSQCSLGTLLYNGLLSLGARVTALFCLSQALPSSRPILMTVVNYLPIIIALEVLFAPISIIIIIML